MRDAVNVEAAAMPRSNRLKRTGARRRAGGPPARSADSVISRFRPAAHDHNACVGDALAAAEDVCADRGAHLTEMRRRVLELVWRHHGPVGAYDIMDMLGRNGRRVAPPTVYRALEFLVANGLVHRIETQNAFVGCGDPKLRHHGQFLICRVCRSVGELADPAIARLVASRARQLGFDAETQTIEIHGLCPECREEKVGARAG
jgi:Fur family zinc uptake transcriptional regulator